VNHGRIAAEKGRTSSDREVIAIKIRGFTFGYLEKIEVVFKQHSLRHALAILFGGKESDVAGGLNGVFIQAISQSLHDRNVGHVTVCTEHRLHYDFSHDAMCARGVGVDRLVLPNYNRPASNVLRIPDVAAGCFGYGFNWSDLVARVAHPDSRDEAIHRRVIFLERHELNHVEMFRRHEPQCLLCVARETARNNRAE
jgi:hypothetical protein